MLGLRKKFISADEYFEIEKAAEYKSEYYYGEIFAMSGASFNHNVIAGNVLADLHLALRHSDCFVFGSDMKVQMEEARYYVYPDISIACGDIRFVPGRSDTIINPIVVIEILSESTREYDMGLKLGSYRKIPSLKECILIDQYSYHVEYFFRNEYHRWVSESFGGLDDRLILRSLDVGLALKNIYHRVKFRTD